MNGNTEHWAAILESLPLGAALFTEGGRLLIANQRYRRLLAASGNEGTPPDGSLFDSPLLPPEASDKLREKTELHFSFGCQESDFYTRLRQADARPIRIDCKITPIEGGGGLLVTLTDVTDEFLRMKSVERRALNAEAAALSANSVIWEYIVSEQMFHSFNEPMADFVRDRGYSPQEFARFTHPDDIPSMVPFVEAMDKGENRPFSFEIRMKVPNLAGEEYQYTVITGIPTLTDGATGKALRYAGARLDATRSHLLNERLKEALRLNKLILESSGLGLVYLDPDFVVQWENISAYLPDSVFCRRFRKDRTCYELAGLTGTGCEDCENCPVELSARTGRVERRERRHEGKDIRMTAIPVLHDDTRFGTILKIEDITEIRHLQEMRLAKEKAEYSSKLKSTLLANMSHEIRTPLNAIIGFSELLSVTEDPEEKRQFTQIIEQNNSLLLQLINDILDFSRIDIDAIRFSYSVVDINRVLKELLMSAEMRKPIKEVELRLAEDLAACPMNVDENRFAQVMNNLLNNAMKFTPKGHVEFGYEARKEEEIYFYVRDTGIGIPADKLDSVFGRFVKLNTFEQGTGLGLAICEKIVEKLQGTIGVKSEVGKGSEFWFTLPLRPVL
ncbi:MAG: ATP-binding protein [Parabacteroides sp.]|nr:ATP-binding protein [Parabacteroides sp.]